jgi:hypothetical protein
MHDATFSSQRKGLEAQNPPNNRKSGFQYLKQFFANDESIQDKYKICEKPCGVRDAR